MSVPSYEALMRPTLETLAEHGEQQFRGLIELVAQRIGLSEEDRLLTIASGEPVVTNRVGWALAYLVQAGAIRRPKRGYSVITDRGLKLLDEADGPINKSALQQFPEFQEFLQRSRTAQKTSLRTKGGDRAQTERVDQVDSETEGSPEEIIEATVATVHSVLAGEVLDRVMQLTPLGFEQLVLRLLGAMGYGASGAIESTAESGDAGIDGVISQDPLGLDRIYVQAKRYAPDRTIGRPAMQAFVGALQGQQADRGVFMATCPFTREALDYADRVGVRVIPIDGRSLAQLMLKHRVGVQPGYVATLLRLDEDFFETL
jgi:restriction system protein